MAMLHTYNYVHIDPLNSEVGELRMKLMRLERTVHKMVEQQSVLLYKIACLEQQITLQPRAPSATQYTPTHARGYSGHMEHYPQSSPSPYEGYNYTSLWDMDDGIDLYTTCRSV